MKILKTTYRNLSLITLLGLGIFSSCEDKSQNYEGVLSPYIMIEDIRTIYKGTDLTLTTEQLNGAEKITGVVISDHTEGNLPEGTLIIQQHRKNRFRGIALNIGSASNTYLQGDSIVVNIANKPLKKDGYLFIDDISESDIEVIERNKTIRIRKASTLDLNNKPNEFESTLVQLLGGEMLPKPTPTTTFLGERILQNGADSIYVVTLETASFKNEIVPRNINITGIVLSNKRSSINSIYPMTFDAIVDVSDPEIPEHIGETPIIITGFANDPQGGDGNNEYIQFKANTDIDFSEVPFSVVTSNNKGSELHTAGWVSGGIKTFKFNITSGQVRKGEYFYVGGTSKRINGGGSTSISQAKWIKNLSTANNASGDGFGISEGNLLANSGNSSGIALFVGTNVTEKSVPIDVIFFGGTTTASVISPDKKLGYRIANTDHYKIYDPESGTSSPFFSMGDGMNDFRFAHHGGPVTGENGYFFKLGGIFNTTTRKWTTPRERTLIQMNLSTQLTEIEEGPGITVQVD